MVIFAFVFNSLTQMRERALSFLVILLPMVCLSNFLSTNISFVLGRFLMTSQRLDLSSSMDALLPFWQFQLPRPISNDIALGAGILLGVGISFFRPGMAEKGARFLMDITMYALKRLLLPIMPLFILGFSLKLAHDQVLGVICQHYLKIGLLLVGVLISYLVLIYGVATRFRPSLWKSALKNMAPAAITGLSTMSSAASLPLMILGAEKNVAQPEVVRGVIPATVNIHLMGDCFAIPLFALALLGSFGQGFPSYETYLIFALYFVMAKFAVAAVPGGGILVMLPILEKHLGFTPEMLSLITVLYITFDPLITSTNVLGNGAFAMIFSRTFARWPRQEEKPLKEGQSLEKMG
jgi:Na+/H+-dicarboxylate symporter